MKRFFPLLLITLVLITGCGSIPGSSKATPAHSSSVAITPTPSDEIELAAKTLIIALATVDYKNSQGWKDALIDMPPLIGPMTKTV